MNEKFEPKITTGGYGDRDFSDEFTWAAAELGITTGDADYFNSVRFVTSGRTSLPSWSDVKTSGYFSLIRNQKSLKSNLKDTIQLLKEYTVKSADALISGVSRSAYRTVMGQTSRDFGWGSNSTAANQGLLLIRAYLDTGERKYLDNALSNIDYLLGRNGTGYSYVTGYGAKSPMHPHHRQSGADGVVAPVPG